MNEHTKKPSKPAILAPAGNRASFLAAIAAGTDAVYCGLKNFSARMEAKNFTLDQLASLARLARDEGIKVYVALNSLVRPDELDKVGSILKDLDRHVRPDGIIIQDLSLVGLARQIGFSGELHLSTLANISFLSALKLVRESLGVNRVVLPRELSIDEIKVLAKECPKGLSLEVFVHGALCYGVSGRCYWSSFLGGKSGLRGRCVQPCRRFYTQKGQKKRFFSCQDLSLDVLAKVLLGVPRIGAWKIEGRKKGPHYVYHTVRAYRMLRDQAGDPEVKKEALELLAFALGRRGTHYNFLSQRPQNPARTDIQTGSGLLIGRTGGAKKRPYLSPRDEILRGDLLRLGYEDEPWHTIYKANKYVPKNGRLDLKLPLGKSPRKGTPIFLVDRREGQLEELLRRLEAKLTKAPAAEIRPQAFHTRFTKKFRKRAGAFELYVYRNKSDDRAAKGRTGLWLSNKLIKEVPRVSVSRLWWWFPPVIWPEDEKGVSKLVALLLKRGARNFVLNAPWQIAMFKNPKGMNIWAGPFCNLANPAAVNMLVSLGYSGVIVSPELSRADYLLLPRHSSLPLGVVIWGNWPLCVSRILCDNLKTNTTFSSPRGEKAWATRFEANYWVYPNWTLDIRREKDVLKKAGYSLFVHLIEPLPRQIELKKRPGLWNWDLGLS
ncbi:MAG: U32 family peptidase [Deltaproteobacteria bacterium]|nr:U32 family peptidase [Deltaproteobacteria bacterium]